MQEPLKKSDRGGETTGAGVPTRSPDMVKVLEDTLNAGLPEGVTAKVTVTYVTRKYPTGTFENPEDAIKWNAIRDEVARVWNALTTTELTADERRHYADGRFYYQHRPEDVKQFKDAFFALVEKYYHPSHGRDLPRDVIVNGIKNDPSYGGWGDSLKKSDPTSGPLLAMLHQRLCTIDKHGREWQNYTLCQHGEKVTYSNGNTMPVEYSEWKNQMSAS